MGSRGLLYHAIAAEWLVETALRNDGAAGSGAPTLPEEMCRGGFGEQLAARLQKLAEQRERTQKEHAARHASTFVGASAGADKMPTTVKVLDAPLPCDISVRGE